jgi:outer membrane protein
MNLNEPIQVSVPDIEMSKQLLEQMNINADTIYKIALQTQPSIRSAQYNLLSSEKGLSVAKGAQYPSLSFFGSSPLTIPTYMIASLPLIRSLDRHTKLGM